MSASSSVALVTRLINTPFTFVAVVLLAYLVRTYFRDKQRIAILLDERASSPEASAPELYGYYDDGRSTPRHNQVLMDEDDWTTLPASSNHYQQQDQPDIIREAVWDAPVSASPWNRISLSPTKLHFSSS